MKYKTFTYRVYPNNQGGLWKAQPFQRGDGYGGLWKNQPFQRGDGIGSFFGRMARRFLPMATKLAKKSVKSIKNSDTLKNLGQSVLENSVQGVTELAANAIDPSNNQSAADTAQLRLDQARNDIANIIRKRPKKDYDSATDSDDSLENIPIVKKIKTSNKRPKKNTRRKKYDVLKNMKYE